jgi:prepilin-type N-terminal cleavage/methylation domain-containing protein
MGKRHGYTLFELVLVLAVLVLLSAIAYPSLKAMYGHYKMTGAVDTVRGAWAQARAHAIEEGRPYRFAIVPGTGQYRVAPDQPDYWSGSPPASDPNGRALVLEKSLPGGVNFAVGGPADSGADPQPDPPAGGASPDSYANPVVFLPDGSAREDAEVIFQVRGARPTAIRLRGLTGIVTVKHLDAGGGP